MNTKQGMSTKKRFLSAIEGKKPDRLPVTTHHVMPYFLRKYLHDMNNTSFFSYFGLDPIYWSSEYLADEFTGEWLNQGDDPVTFNIILSENWLLETQEITGLEYPTKRYSIKTPKGDLTTVIQLNEYTGWIKEHLIKDKKDIEIIAEYATAPKCDIYKTNKLAEEVGQNALIRGTVCSFYFLGQPGVWQDAACLYGIEKLIMATYDDPKWVKEFLEILLKRKLVYINSLKGAKYDILELGGGDASSTVISPNIFDEFVAPYDKKLIDHAHLAGQKIVYHTCGGMMPILNNIKAMNPDAMETFTPPGMGGMLTFIKLGKSWGIKCA